MKFWIRIDRLPFSVTRWLHRCPGALPHQRPGTLSHRHYVALLQWYNGSPAPSTLLHPRLVGLLYRYTSTFLHWWLTRAVVHSCTVKLAHCYNGKLAQCCNGKLAHCCNGKLTHCCIGARVYRRPGALLHRQTGAFLHWHTVAPAPWCSVQRCLGTKKFLEQFRTAELLHLCTRPLAHSAYKPIGACC